MGLIKVKLKAGNKKNVRSDNKLFGVSKENVVVTNSDNIPAKPQIETNTDFDTYLTHIGSLGSKRGADTLTISDEMYQKYHEDDDQASRKKVKVQHNEDKKKLNKTKKKVIKS